MTVISYELAIKNRERTAETLRKAGYILRKKQGMFNYNIFDSKRVKLDSDGLVENDGYIGYLNTKRVDIYTSETGIEDVLKDLHLPVTQGPA